MEDEEGVDPKTLNPSGHFPRLLKLSRHFPVSMMSLFGPEELAVIVRGYELRLLRCTLTPPPCHSISQQQSSDHNSSNTHPLRGVIHELLTSIESGDYLKALTSAASRLVFKLGDSYLDNYDCSVESACRYYTELLDRVEYFIKDSSENETDMVFRAMAAMCIAVAAFLLFTQCSMTGPLMELPRFPLLFGNVDDFVDWDKWARDELMSAGSDLLGKFSNLQFIVFAKMLLMRIKDLLFEGTESSVSGMRSLSWWLARVMLLQQRILAEQSSSLYNQLHGLMGEALQQFGILEKVKSYWNSSLHDEEVLVIVSMAHLEAGIVEYVYGRVDSCRLHLENAVEAVGLDLSLTGALGYRTKHQVEPKAQMVLQANKIPSTIEENFLAVGPGTRKPDFSGDNADMHFHSLEMREASEIFMTPKLLVNDNESGSGHVEIESGAHSTAHLTGVQQLVILAQCLLIEKSTPQDEMQKWDMAPYIEAIDSQHSSCFMIRCFSDILRVRWESTRSRTKERALLIMNEMIQGFCNSSPEVAKRIYFSFGVYIPSIPALRKEYGELLVRCSLIGEAINIFEDLELWDNLIVCYCLMDKKPTAVELIKKRLCETPNDPRLWCSLGDTTDNDACYKRALEVSNDKSVRAKRALARNAYNRGDYEMAKVLWESAMAMNSLFPNGWFALGAAALKARDVDKALDAFTRAVQLDPENGEAWNNIACLHMIKKRSKEAFIAFKEALKFKRNSWQMWENFSHVALDVDNVSQALEAMQKVLDLSGNKGVHVEILERIMTDVESRASKSQSRCSVITNDQNSSNWSSQVELDGQSGASMSGTSHETENLVMLLGKILQQIVRSGGKFAADVWGLYARWHRLKGDLLMCSEALLKQVRSLQGSDVWKDRMRFKKFAKASIELCKAYIEISLSTGSRKELFAAEMHLKSTIKQGEGFSDTEEFGQLQACHENVKMRLQSVSAPS